MSTRLYRILLRLYPASFREEYGREMAGVFERGYRQRRTATARAAFWIDNVTDILINAAAIHGDVLRQDLHAVSRTVRRAPGFAITVIAVAALGIAATTATVALADHVLLRPLPFHEPDRIVGLWQDRSAQGYPRVELSPPNFRDWRRESTSFSSMAAYWYISLYFPDPSGSPVRIDGAVGAGDLFGVIAVQPSLGRVLTDDDDRDGADAVIVLSDELWRARFNADPAIVGQTIAFTDRPRLVVGVMPPALGFPTRSTRFWVPAQLPASAYADDQRGNLYWNAVGRLRPGVSVDTARSELNVIAKRLAVAFPRTNAGTGAAVLPLRDTLTPQSRQLLWGLAAAAAALLLIACTNLANLLLGRALVRQRELAVRAALGAGRHRLVRQMLTETLALTGAGGLIGIVTAGAAVPFVARLVPTALPIAESPSIDGRMVIIAVAATAATAIGVVLFPALRLGRHSSAAALREGARAGTSRRTERTRQALVIAEIAASVALLVCTGLLVRALLKVEQVNPGFQSDNVLTVRTTVPAARYRDEERRLQFYARVLADVRALPGVASVSYISYLPMVMRGGVWPVAVDGAAEEDASGERAIFRQVTPGFFATMETPIVRGRDFNDLDTPRSQPVAIVSESFVKRYWPSRDPIGASVSIGMMQRTVVGVAHDILVRGLERETEPQLYIPATQGTAYPGYYPRELVVRTSATAANLAPAVRAIVARIDPLMEVADVRTLSDVVAGETAPRRVQVRVIASFAALAVLLAAIGLHGLLAFSVSSRARDIGVRRALGASPAAIVSMLARDAMSLATLGIALGGVLAFMGGRALQALLAGVSPMDPLALGVAIAVALVMTAAGMWLPARRALRVDPITVIRTE